MILARADGQKMSYSNRNSAKLSWQDDDVRDNVKSIDNSGKRQMFGTESTHSVSKIISRLL